MDTEKLGLVDQALSWRNHGTQGAHHVCYIELNREVTACPAQGGRACDTQLDQGDRCSKLILWEQFLWESSPCEGAVQRKQALWTFSAGTVNIHTWTVRDGFAISLSLAQGGLCHFPTGLRLGVLDMTVPMSTALTDSRLHSLTSFLCSLYTTPIHSHYKKETHRLFPLENTWSHQSHTSEGLDTQPYCRGERGHLKISNVPNLAIHDRISACVHQCVRAFVRAYLLQHPHLKAIKIGKLLSLWTLPHS